MERHLPDPIRICMLGRFEVERAGRLLASAGWTRRKAASLLQRLALERRLVRDQAIEALWPEADPASGANNLYRTLHELRQTLDGALGEGAASGLLIFHDGVLQLGDGAWVDVEEFTKLASSDDIRDATQALQLYGGPLLPDERYAEWADAPREACLRLHHRASMRIAGHRRGSGDLPAAIAILSSLAAQDPADEATQRELMECYALAGRRHEAIRQYQKCAAALRDEFGLEAEPATTALYHEILEGAFAPHPAPPATSPSALSKPSPRWSVFGREAETQALESLLVSAGSGVGRLVFIAGEPGIGKTRLADETIRAAAAMGFTVLRGAAYEEEGPLPYQPFLEAFDRFLSDRNRSPDENPIMHFEPGGGDPQQEQWAMFNASAAFIRDLALEAPTLIFLDDLHAADPSTFQILHYLGRRLRDVGVLIIASYRSDAVVSQPALRSLLHALYRERLAEKIELEPISPEASAMLLRRAAGGEISEDIERRVLDLAEGNPLFMEELARDIAQVATDVPIAEGRSAPRRSDWRVPTGLGEMMRARVSRLGPQAEQALTAASVLGREFAFRLLVPLSALDEGALLAAIDAGLGARLIEETASGYRFRHGLIRRALYEGMHAARRARLHWSAAKAMEGVTEEGSHPDPFGDPHPHAEALSFHYELSDEPEKALPYLVQAGLKASRLYGFEVAVGYFEGALNLMDKVGASDPELRFRILGPLGRCHALLADTPRAVACLEEALALSSSAVWPLTALERATLHAEAATALITAGDTESAEAHLEAATADVGNAVDTPEAASVLYTAAQFHWHRGDYQQAYAAARKSLSAAEAIGAREPLARAFEMLALACHSLGEWKEGLAFEHEREALAGPALDVSDAYDLHL